MKKNESYEVWSRANSIFKWRFLFVFFSCFESRLMMISPSFHLSLTDSKGRRKGRKMNKILNFVWIYCFTIGHSFTAERCELTKFIFWNCWLFSCPQYWGITVDFMKKKSRYSWKESKATSRRSGYFWNRNRPHETSESWHRNCTQERF